MLGVPVTLIHRWTGSLLLRIKLCRLWGTEPLPEPVLTYFNQSTKTFIQEGAFDNFICQMSTILSWQKVLITDDTYRRQNHKALPLHLCVNKAPNSFYTEIWVQYHVFEIRSPRKNLKGILSLKTCTWHVHFNIIVPHSISNIIFLTPTKLF